MDPRSFHAILDYSKIAEGRKPPEKTGFIAFSANSSTLIYNRPTILVIRTRL